MTSKDCYQIWTVEVRIPKGLLKWHSKKIREILEFCRKELEAIGGSYRIGGVTPRIKVKMFLD